MSSEYLDLENLIKLAAKTGKLYAGSQAYKMFSSLPCTDSGVLFESSSASIEIIENGWLGPSAICAIKPSCIGDLVHIKEAD